MPLQTLSVHVFITHPHHYGLTSTLTPSMSSLLRALLPVGAAVATWNTTPIPMQASTTLQFRDMRGQENV